MNIVSTHVPAYFSVIIPCWNSAGTLPATLDSLMSQDFANWEAFIVDDGSTDNTPDIIEEYCARDYRIKALKTMRSGPSNARNVAGLNHLNSKFIAFLDSDDLWAPQKLSSIFRRANLNQQVNAFYSRIAFFSSSEKDIETVSTVYDKPLTPYDLLRDNPVCTLSNLVIKTSVFVHHQGFDPLIVHNEDVEFLVRVTAAGALIASVDETLVYYRTNTSGLSSHLASMRAGWQKALGTLQNLGTPLSPQQLAAADAGNLRYLARRALRTGAPGFEAFKLALKGVCRSPRSFFNPFWRGGMTFGGAMVAPFLPKSIRKFAFSR